MSRVAFGAPILPGKQEQWEAFMAELQGPRRAEFDETRRAAGVREQTFVQQTPDGHALVVVTMDGDNAEDFLHTMAEQDTEFSRWFVGQVRDIHGFDIGAPLPGPVSRLVIDSGPVEG